MKNIFKTFSICCLLVAFFSIPLFANDFVSGQWYPLSGQSSYKIAHFRPNGYFFFTFVGHSDLLYFDPNFSGTATMFNSLVSTLMLAQTLGYSVDFYSDYTDGNGYHRVTALDIHP
jgi:hypothetical protein